MGLDCCSVFDAQQLGSCLGLKGGCPALEAPGCLICQARQQVLVGVCLTLAQQVAHAVLHLTLHLVVQSVTSLPVGAQGGAGRDGLPENEVGALGRVEGEDTGLWAAGKVGITQHGNRNSEQQGWTEHTTCDFDTIKTL